MRLPTCEDAVEAWPVGLGAMSAEADPGKLTRRFAEVEVWRIDLDLAPAAVAQLLSPDERERAQRIVPALARARWIRARGALRALLGERLERDPAKLVFTAGRHGKPELAGELTGAVHFNLSHTANLALLAVSGQMQVGVDVERTRERFTHEFLRAWTLREAIVKCLGTGLAHAPQGAEWERAAGGLRTAELDVGPGACAAVAVGDQAQPAL